MKLTPAKVTMMMLMAVAGLIGLYIVKGLFAVQKPPTRSLTVNIPLAAATLSPGTKITRDHIGMGPFPQRELKEDMLRSERVIVGRVVKVAIKPGSPLQGSQLYEPGENAPLQVAEGKQAVSVQVKNSSDMVDGLIKPGEFVDVHFTIDAQSSSGIDPRIHRLGGVSMTLFKGVKVLALNKNFRQGPVLASGNSVTLELAPEQVNVMLVVQSNGAIALAHNPSGEGDGGVALSNTDRATLWEVLGLKKAAQKKEPPEPEKPFVTESYRGTRGGSLEWDKAGKKFRDNYSGNRGNGNNGYSGGVVIDPSARSLGADQQDDDFDPNDVFQSPGGASQGSAAPSEPVQQDPDIPVTDQGPIRGVRSRTGTILRARPQSAGPTALRN